MTAQPWDPPREVARNPGRVADTHTSILFDARMDGGHVRVKVRAATRGLTVQVDHSRALCGELVMKPEEWLLLRAVLAEAETPGPLWMLRDNRGRLVAGAGPDVSYHDQQQFIEIQGWPE